MSNLTTVIIKRILPMAGLAALTMLPASCDPEKEPLTNEAIDGAKGHSSTTPTDSVVPTDTITPVDTIAPVDSIIPIDSIIPLDTIPITKLRDVSLFFTNSDMEFNLDSTVIDAFIADSTIQNVFLTPIGSWKNIKAHGIKYMRKSVFQPILNQSAKFHGRGNFDFAPGAAASLPSDSLWYVQNGWTINRKPTPADTVKHDIEILFPPQKPQSCYSRDLIKACDDDSTIRTVYLTPMGHWGYYTVDDINNLYITLAHALASSPKLRGRGDFDFKPGEVSKQPKDWLPPDSIWFIENGWTINGAGKEH